MELNIQDIYCTDFMVDVETTGVQAGVNAMIQLSCVPFSFDHRIVSPRQFDIALQVPDSLQWDPKTRAWWENHPDKSEVLKHLIATGIPAKQAMEDFAAFVRQMSNGGAVVRFWQNRNFDWGFVQHYFTLTGVKNPFHYHHVIEMISFMKGLRRAPYYEYEPESAIPFVGIKHNAIDDSRHQIKRLFWSCEHVR